MHDDGARTSDGDLLRRYATQGAEEAFAELVARHLDLVYSAALRQVGGDAHAAHDVAQVVFATLARKAGALASHPVLAGWLYTSTHLAAAKHRRTEARRRAHEKAVLVMNEDSDPMAAIDWDRLRPVLDEAMAGLRDRDREAVLLRYFAQRPFAEIGAAFQVSEDGARMRVDRALEKLRVLLARRGVTSTTAALVVALTNQAVAAAPTGLAAQLTGLALVSGGAASATSGIVYFMSTTKFVSAVAAAVVLLSVGVAVHELQREAAARDALAEAQREQVIAAAGRVALEAKIRAADDAVAHAAHALADARAAAAKTAAAQRASDNDAGLAAGNEVMARFPAVRAAVVERSYARIRARYQALYAKLQLTPEQIAKFEDLLLDYEGVGTDMATMGQVFLRPGKGRTQAEVENGLRDLLGETGYAAYREQMNWNVGQQFTLQLAEALYFTETPLTVDQSRVVTQAMLDAGKRSRPPGQSRDWEFVFEQARTALTAPQLAALDRMRVQEDFQAALRALFTK